MAVVLLRYLKKVCFIISLGLKIKIYDELMTEQMNILSTELKNNMPDKEKGNKEIRK